MGSTLCIVFRVYSGHRAADMNAGVISKLALAEDQMCRRWRTVVGATCSFMAVFCPVHLSRFSSSREIPTLRGQRGAGP